MLVLYKKNNVIFEFKNVQNTKLSETIQKKFFSDFLKLIYQKKSGAGVKVTHDLYRVSEKKTIHTQG